MSDTPRPEETTVHPDATEASAEAAPEMPPEPPQEATADGAPPEAGVAPGSAEAEAHDASASAPEGAPIDLEDLPAGPGAVSSGATLELLYDLSLPLTVELGRAALKVQEVLELGQGSVIRLDRVAGDPVDVYVGAKKLAQAEVVVLDDQFGIRITHIYPEAGTGGS